MDQRNRILQVRTLAKACDPDRYLAALFATDRQREALWTLVAFNCELARIPHIVRETMLGKMRLQWWHDVVAGSGQGSSRGSPDAPPVLYGHPVADSLVDVIGHFGLDQDLFYRMIEARQLGLENRPFRDRQALEAYNDTVWGNMYRLAWHIVSSSEQEDTVIHGPGDSIFTQAGQVTGMAEMLRLAGAETLAGRCIVPLDRVGEDGLTAQMVLEPSPWPSGSSGLASWLESRPGKIRDGLVQLSARLEVVPGGQRAAFLPLGLLTAYLDVARKREGLLFAAPVDINPLTRFLRLWKVSRKGAGLDI